MFWNHKINDPNKVYIPYKGGVYNSMPGQFTWTQTGANQLLQVTFAREVAVNYIYFRQGPANCVVSIHGEQYGPQLQADVVNCIGYQSNQALVGAITLNRLINGLTLNATLNVHQFNIDPWRTKSLYFSGNLAGQYLLNMSYVFV